MDIEALIDAYLERFDQPIPYALANSLTDSELAALLQKSLDTGQPLDYAEEPGQIY